MVEIVTGLWALIPSWQPREYAGSTSRRCCPYKLGLPLLRLLIYAVYPFIELPFALLVDF